MSDTRHIPSLSSIVDQMVTRLEHLREVDGDPDERKALTDAIDVMVSYAMRQQRLARLIVRAKPGDVA